MKVIKDYSPLVTGFEVKKGDSMMKSEHREKELVRLKLLKTQEHLFAIARVFIENDWMDKKITFDPFLSMEVIYEDDTTIKHEILSKFKEVVDEDEYMTGEEWERIRKDFQSRCTKIETPYGTAWLHPAPNLSSPGTFR